MLLSACTRCTTEPAPLYTAQWTAPSPPATGTHPFLFYPLDPGGQPIRNGQLKIEATMTHPGMPSVFAEANDDGTGHYPATLTLDMPGHWVFLLEMRLSDGRIIHMQTDVPQVQQAK